MAEPAPARRGGTADMMAAVIGDIDAAIPQVIGKSATRASHELESTPRMRSRAKPEAISSIPAATTRLAPNRALSHGVDGATMSMIGAIGSRRMAAWNGVSARTSWKYWVSRNIIPYMARKMSIIPLVPTEKAGLRK